MMVTGIEFVPEKLFLNHLMLLLPFSIFIALL